MNEKRNSELEGMLRAVQDIKSEYYIGTGEAYKSIKRMSGVYENPERLSKMINEHLRSRGTVTFPASPERIDGLLGIVNHAFQKSNDVAMEVYGSDEVAVVLSNYEVKVLTGFEDLTSIFLDSPEKCYDVLYPIFEMANQKGVTGNLEFKKLIGDYLSSELLKEESKIPADDSSALKIFEFWSYSFQTGIKARDWESEMTSENFRDKERFMVKSAMSEISIGNMVERLQRDRVEHIMEYKRAVLCKWLRDLEIEDYDSAIEICETQLKRRQKMLERLSGINPHEGMLNDQERMVNGSKYLRHALGQEKNFVIRYLEH